MKKEIIHRDLLGKIIKVNDIVAFAQNGTQYVGKITKLTPKRVKITRITEHDPKLPSYWRQEYYQRPPSDVVIVEGSHVTAYILKQSQ